MRDDAVTLLGYPGKHGERGDIFWHGWRFSLQEAQNNTDVNAFNNWRFVLYDYTSDEAYPAPITSSIKSPCHGNPRLAQLTEPNDGLDLMVTGYVFGPGNGQGGCLVGNEKSGPVAYTVPVTRAVSG